ncbi:MAG: FAD-dependent oxidoreductase [Lachnospiraceae bacterium]|nr:FAD-dependent oxidoreductase [Lachnospiraceae bacterium]
MVIMRDVIIIGSGPAGLSAAVYGKRAALDVLVVEKEATSGGQIINTYEVDNYLGLKGINGFEMAMKFREHADQLGAEFIVGEAGGIEMIEPGHPEKGYSVKIDNGISITEEATKCIIIATGAKHALLGVDGETRFTGRGVSYCATCDGAFFRNKTAIVVGGGDVAVEDAIYLSNLCSKVILVHRRDQLRAVGALQEQIISAGKVEFCWDSVVTSINGEDRVSSVNIRNVRTGEETSVDTDAVFIAVGMVPINSAALGVVDLDDKGYIIAGEDCKTSQYGIFAAGDIRTKKLRQIITAAADGAVAITGVSELIG